MVSLTYLDYGVDHEDSYYKEIGIPKELVLLIKNTSEFEWHLRMHPVQLKYSHKRISKYLKNLFSNNKNVYWEEPSKTSLSQALLHQLVILLLSQQQLLMQLKIQSLQFL